MSEHLINFQEAGNDIFLAATYLAENIGSSDGRAESIKEVVGYLLKRGEVDLAAQLADTIEDSFTRDRLLSNIAEKCAALNDDEYARQLAEAIEDQGLQQIAIERIAFQKALADQFDSAAQIAEELDNPSEAWAAIAYRQAAISDLPSALQTIENIEYELSKVNALLEIAALYTTENPEKACEIVEQALTEASKIDFAEDKIRTQLNISEQFSAAGRKDRAIEVLSEAKSIVEEVGGAHRQGFLSLIAYDFLRAGSVDLADRTLDLVEDKTQLASCLSNFSDEFANRNEDTDAREALDEAYQILISQADRETRDTASKLSVLNAIAVRFAEFKDYEKAIQISHENPIDTGRDETLSQIALIALGKENETEANRSFTLIADNYTKSFALLGAFDLFQKNENQDAAKKYLRQASEMAGNITPPASQSTVHNELSKRFFSVHEIAEARFHALESLKILSRITDESLRVTALAKLGDWYREAEFKLTDEEKDILRTMLRKSEW